METFLTINQLSEVLQVNRRTLYDWTHIGFIPHYKLPKGVRFKREEVDQWLKKRHQNGRLRYNVILS